MRHSFCLPVVLAGTFLFVSALKAQTGYDPANEVTLQGSVDAVQTPAVEFQAPVVLSISADEQPFDVMLGPAWFVKRLGFDIAPSYTITVTGIVAMVEGKETFIARKITVGDAVLVLRNARGEPLWEFPYSRPAVPVG